MVDGFFKHDIHALDDVALRALVRAHKGFGYAVFFSGVEVLYQLDGEGIDLTDFIISIKEALREDSEMVPKITDIVKDCVDKGLFEIKDNLLFSKRVTEACQKIQDMRKKCSEAGIKGLQKRWGNDTEDSTPYRVPYNPPYKVPLANPIAEKRREEKNKEKDTTSVVSKKKPTPISRFSVPTLQEVMKYCSERGNSIDPQKFIDFYESKGWLVGKSPMKDWKAAVRNWERSEKSQLPKSKICNDAELMRAEALPDGGVNL